MFEILAISSGVEDLLFHFQRFFSAQLFENILPESYRDAVTDGSLHVL